MPGWLIASVIVVCLVIWVTSWTLAHVPWIALGAVLGWFCFVCWTARWTGVAGSSSKRWKPNH
jgi:hypothetical protein